MNRGISVVDNLFYFKFSSIISIELYFFNLINVQIKFQNI